MRAHALSSQDLGVFENSEFKGHAVFSLGQPSVVRPDNFGPIHVFNDDFLYPKSFVGMHPHANTEVLTVVIDGFESHKDNLGYSQELHSNAVQLISSGSGIYHAGGNLWNDKTSRHLQIWIAPKARNTKPDIQLKSFEPAQRKNRWQLQVAPSTEDNILSLKQDVWCYRGSFEAGKSARHTLRKRGHGVMLFVLDGLIAFAGKQLQRQDTLFVAETDALELEIKAPSDLWLMETVL
ncbi:pirin family protein [Hyalangium versicolor]|uniref:pirin family protein n=1 Tax=Hyalangium versicolor TaxID=2861190 RepID=UPI001CD01E51|nr:pirin family protein [Hyalangium versicolor]